MKQKTISFIYLILLSLIIISCTSEDLNQLQQSNNDLKFLRKMETETANSQIIYDKIQTGMSMDEVKVAAGAPLKVIKSESSYSTTEYWYYEGKISVTFQDGYVLGKMKR